MKKLSTMLVLAALLGGVPACSSNGGTGNVPPGDNGGTDGGPVGDDGTNTIPDGGGPDGGGPDGGDAGNTPDAGPSDIGDTGPKMLDVTPVDDGSVPDAGPMDENIGDVTPADDSVVPDVPVTDSGVDVPVTDSGVDVPVTDSGVDVPMSDVPPTPYNPCLPGRLINLSAVGTVSGATTRYTGTNVGVDASNPFGAVTCGRPGHGVALEYTTRSTTRLVVSTVNPGTPTTFDTVAFALTGCGPVSPAVQVLGCNDDSGDATRSRASRFTTSTLPAGTLVTLVVAGYTPRTGAPWTETGPFELSVTELPQVSVGGACDPAGTTNFCTAGSTCMGTGAAARCVPDGTAGGACRTGAGTTPCDAGLGCASGSNTCVTPVPAGGTCLAGGAPCASGSACITGTCRATGSAGGQCRPTGTPCDPGLTCSGPPATATSRCSVPVVTYTESPLPAPTWIDACAAGGTHVVLLGGADPGTNRDDNHAAVAVTLPFAFRYYGLPQTAIWPDTNGYAQFGAEPSDSTGGTGYIPSTSDGPVLAPFWTDLVLRDPVAPSTNENLCVRTVGTAPARQFVIEWQDVLRYGHTTTHLTFELVLSETTNIVDYIYNTLTGTAADATYVNGTLAAIGLQSDAGMQFTLHAGAVSTAAGIRFSPH